MRQAWLAGLALSACVASESGNAAQRCDDSRSCEVGEFCYRGFCVEEEQQVDPVTVEDASSVDASSMDAALVVEDSAVEDAARESEADARVVDAGRDAGRDAGSDSGTRDAGRDAGKDAGKPRVDAGLLCQLECKPPQQNSSACKKCLKAAYGEEPDKLCGKPNEPNEDDADDDKTLGANDPLCVSLCLGTASMNPSCLPQLFCNGPKCGGLP